MDSFQATLFPGLPPQRLLGPIFEGLTDDKAALGAVVLLCHGVGRQRTCVAALASELRVVSSQRWGEVHVGSEDNEHSTLRAVKPRQQVGRGDPHLLSCFWGRELLGEVRPFARRNHRAEVPAVLIRTLEFGGELFESGFSNPLLPFANVGRTEVPLENLVLVRQVLAVGISVGEAPKHIVADELLEVEVVSFTSQPEKSAQIGGTRHESPRAIGFRPAAF